MLNKYECDGQLSFDDFIQIDKSEFNPLEALALCGTGFVDGMKRVHKFFTEQHTLQEKAQFLKKEYGIGGFGSPVKKPCYIHDMSTFSNSKKDIEFEYYDEDMNNVSSSASWTELAKCITNMISNGTYKYEKGD